MKYCTRLFGGKKSFLKFQGGGGVTPAFLGGGGVGLETKRTVDLFQAWLLWDWRSRMFVERTPVTGELQLFVNIDVLISEDLRPGCSGDTEVQGPWTITHKRRPARQRVAI
jgi:hypothetical protein